MNYKKSNGLNYILISDTALFHGCSPVETEKLLSGMQFFTKAYKKGVPVYHAGTPVSDIGIVLHGVVQIENNDLWGNKNIHQPCPGRRSFCRSICLYSRRTHDG